MQAALAGSDLIKGRQQQHIHQCKQCQPFWPQRKSCGRCSKVVPHEGPYQCISSHLANSAFSVPFLQALHVTQLTIAGIKYGQAGKTISASPSRLLVESFDAAWPKPGC